ncbi:MAG: glycosyltransferase family 4 protein [Candidatus Portnoybacteria bacterium CG_4_9_14_3_um_filter_43_11]|uniref:Glycosyltransferase family 4 protein n=1 Tax=Candidatus Portnoybacteria bacterium CG_4_9_14_3_um_filter_43_11 TaxID=1974805 RepID=A0A2M7YMG9_9BACT|nr:MAG: glycosyltransferase family 4 protein [Candidatus Portnoybacteria bacterium CG_4_9_14_3_um_filter_43_11]
MKVALIHDYLIRCGGAERVFFNLRQIFPRADIYTLLYDKKEMGKYFPKTEIGTSFLQKFPKIWRKNHKYLLPFLPTAAESFDLREYDLVISSSSSFIKGVISRPKAVHICYCHSPMRFSWDYYSNYIGEQKKGFLLSLAARLLMHYIRMWDRSAAERVDYFIANSKTTAWRIKRYYGKEPKIIYPPVDLGMKQVFSTITDIPKEKYFLIVSQLTPYKKINLAVEAFNKLDLPLIIIGQGPEKKRLEKMALGNIKFLGWQPDAIVKYYYQNCLAMIFPGEDDFGIAPVEAMSFGRPVLAYRKGGATETVIEGITGEFFDDLAVESLADGVRRLTLNLSSYSPLVIRKAVEKFSRERFEIDFREFVIQALEKSGSL